MLSQLGDDLFEGGDKVKYFEGTPIPTSLLLICLILIAAANDALTTVGQATAQGAILAGDNTVSSLSQKLLGVISGGAAGSWAMTNLAPRALADNFAPGFYVKHILKDIRIAVESARELGLEVPGMRGAQELYERVAALGWEEFGTQVLYRLYTTP